LKTICVAVVVAPGLAAAAATYPLTLYVANQSFDLNPVDIKVTLDGDVVAQGIYFAATGRNWRRYDLSLGPGRHVLHAVTRKGAAGLRREFRVGGPRWAAVAFRFRSPAHGSGTIRYFYFDIRERPYGE
ncbi:MAG: hypothetical protein JSU81_01290, partial [Candidatus Coatesbacteria bacterium]